MTNKWTATPPITEQRKATHITSDATYSQCKSGDATLHSGTSHVERDVHVSCTGHAAVASDQKTLVWNNGKSSVADFQHTGNASHGAGTIDNEGKVSSGEFAGSSFSEKVTDPDPHPGDCASGISGGTGTGTLRIFH